MSSLALPLPGFVDTASVYGPDPTTGEHTILLTDNLICLLSGGGKYTATTAKDRIELASWRQLLFDPTYEMPENVQIEVDGVRYNAVPGSFISIKVAPDSILYRRGDFIRSLT